MLQNKELRILEEIGYQKRRRSLFICYHAQSQQRTRELQSSQQDGKGVVLAQHYRSRLLLCLHIISSNPIQN
jgi:hypothetical protein